ncbi:MAG: efflux RND transporter periplasmic adaptor subunit [Fimbriimonas sp.]
MNRWILLTAAGAAVLATAGCVDRTKQEQAKRTSDVVTDHVTRVTVQPARTESMTEELEITGDIVTGQDTVIGAKQPGKIVAVYVKEGDSVSAGSLIATLDTSQLMAQLRQAQAQVGQAQAGMSQALSALAQARRNASVGPTKTSSAVRSAEAQVRSAKAQLQKVLNGARPEERRQAEATLATAKSNLAMHEKELERIRVLVNEGALAGNRLDQQQNLVENARNQVENAEQVLSMMKTGAREEDISSAREAVKQAQEALQAAKSQKELDPMLQDQVRGAEASVQATRSQLDAARAQVSLVQQNIADMQIRAPFAGKIYGKPAQAGAMVGAGAQVARLIGGGGIYFNGQVPATVVDQIRPGMPVEVSIDGLPGKTYIGNVETISPLGENVGRLFLVRVQLGNAAGIKPGMFARGLVTLRTIQNATVVPVDAVVGRGSDKFVYYLDGDKAREAKVTTGLQKGIWVQVTGVPMGAQVVVDGQQALREGVKVKVETTKTAVEVTKERGS